MLTETQIRERLSALEGWSLASDGKSIHRELKFANYHETMAFVNALAWIAHRADHHPDLEVGYSRCLVRYSTHSAGGVTGKDLDLARRIDEIVAGALA